MFFHIKLVSARWITGMVVVVVVVVGSLQNNIVILYDIEQKKRTSSFEICMQFSVDCSY